MFTYLRKYINLKTRLMPDLRKFLLKSFQNWMQISNIALAKKQLFFSGPIAQLVRVEDS